MSYQALYRQWRPIDFDEIIGQDHITTPLKNQILSKSYGHAYIFSGTRGTGKTSTAKILARAVNCLNNTDGNPCNKCENCLSILDDQFIDVVEMDGQQCLLLQDRDIDFVVEEWEEVPDPTPSPIIQPDKKRLIV